MSDVAIRSCCTVDELIDAASLLAFYVRRERDRAWARSWLANFELERMLASFDDGAAVGAVGAFRFTLKVPGGQALPTRGLAQGGVAPSHRRRGIFEALIVRHLRDAEAQGEPLSYVYPSSEAGFRRFGFGTAAPTWHATVPRAAGRFRGDLEPSGRVRHVSRATALELFPPIYDRATTLRPGTIARKPSWWRHMTLADPVYRRGGGGPAVYALLERSGVPAAYAIYRLTPTRDDDRPVVSVGESVAVDDDADVALWRYLLDIDAVSAVVAELRIDHPLFHLLDEPAKARLRVLPGAALRIVDLERALPERAWAGGHELVLDVGDPLFERNAGRWRISREGVLRTRVGADLSLRIDDLAAAYLGAVTFAELRAAGRVDVRREGAVDRADTLFRVSRKPWCVGRF